MLEKFRANVLKYSESLVRQSGLYIFYKKCYESLHAQLTDKLTSAFHASVLLLLMNFFVTLSKKLWF